jgi:hypothetical protein
MLLRGGSHWTAYADATTCRLHCDSRRREASRDRMVPDRPPGDDRLGDRAVIGRLLPLLLPNWVERAATGRYGAARNCR